MTYSLCVNFEIVLVIVVLMVCYRGRLLLCLFSLTIQYSVKVGVLWLVESVKVRELYGWSKLRKWTSCSTNKRRSS